MKKLVTIVLCITFLVFTGCTSAKNEPAPKPPVESDTTHLTSEDKGLVISTSREVRNMTQMIKPAKQENEVISVLVKVENNSKSNIIISPDFITLKTSDGTEHKYSASLTNSQPLGKSAFTKRTVPPDYRGGGLLLFEIKSGLTAESLVYSDDSGHNITLKYQSTQTKSNI